VAAFKPFPEGNGLKARNYSGRNSWDQINWSQLFGPINVGDDEFNKMNSILLNSCL
jgi:hypothetical protein